MKTLIAIPCMDQVPALFAQSLACLKMVGECQIAFQMGSLVYTSRNELAKFAIKNEFDYVFWLDSDMVFDDDILIRMMAKLQEQDLDMLTGLYFRRVMPYSPVLFDELSLRKTTWKWSNFETIPEHGLFEVGGCGFGCVLMSTDVLMSVQGKHRQMFHPLNNGGEDLSFCWRARDCGYKIMCDPEIVCGHVGYAVVNDAFYRNYQKGANDEGKG